MTAYNRQELIKEAIESVQQSTYLNYELIIVDDLSMDHTYDVIKNYAATDNKIRYYQNEKNLGDYPNRNRAAGYAKGEYITYLDSDDKMLPDGLEKRVDAMLRFPDANIGMYWMYSKEASFCLSQQDVLKQHFLMQQILFIGPGGTLMKRSFFQDINGYPEKYGPANDMYFNLKAACYSKVVLFPFEFIFYRLHDNQENKNEYSYLFNNYLYLRDALRELPLPLSEGDIKWISKKSKRRFLVNLVKYFMKTGNFNQLQQAIRVTKYNIRDFLTAIFQ